MIPVWARRRSPEEQRAFELETLAREVEEWRKVDARELGRRMTDLARVATASARRSPYWAQATAPEPMPPEAAQRWAKLIATHRGSGS